MEGSPDVDLAVAIGETSCSAKHEVSQADAIFGGTPAMLYARVRTIRIGQDGPGGIARSVGDYSELLTFHGLPTGSTLIVEWGLYTSRVDAEARVNFLGSPIANTFGSNEGTIPLPIINGTVGMTADINAYTTGTGTGEWTLALAFNNEENQSTRVIDANGLLVKGFTYSARSGRPFNIQDGMQVSVPEPSTALSLLAPLAWVLIRRRKS